ncbi:ATPase WRNIP1-like isoform X1 [Plodia interpunctella]|uniref:ATPase WRNIP1-like isoform X1 n=1 Tax=Plodia interpunctella TaxID=58824 RepID=UPI002367B8CA|nr:ATPase WRNIP1-like isoform X1 [Plodia interpunctella]XP_053601356.1 ATPase WRNIP1-like isoform X1 [Plodia interpunctella]
MASVNCPVCDKQFQQEIIEEHVNKCLFLNTKDTKSISTSKRNGSHFESTSPHDKKIKLESHINSTSSTGNLISETTKAKKQSTQDKPLPLAEKMRPLQLDELVGQQEAFGPGSMLRAMLHQKKVPNMILWGPPGCGKTSLANVVANICKEQNNMRFVKLSATMAGINDVKEIVKVAKNESQFKRQTVLFMDEIHRFNKLQQDTFLPHVENGTITLIGATTENPSFSLNNALLSRCRVVVMQKLSIEDVLVILKRAIKSNGQVQVVSQMNKEINDNEKTRYIVEEESLKWLAEVSDGDARMALGALELTLTARDPGDELHVTGPAILSVEDIKNGIKRSHMVYDRQGEEHYNTISAIHKSIRASEDNAALYWTTRALHGGEDPLYIARRLIRAACEDIGLADPTALVEAVACLQGCQHVGRPECDVLLVQCAVRLARAPKSREVYQAMKRCQQSLTQAKGPLPPIPLHLRNATSKLMKQIGYGRGYNLRHKDESGLVYMPEGMEHVDFFSADGGDNFFDDK